jgi:hypothetical protein
MIERIWAPVIKVAHVLAFTLGAGAGDEAAEAEALEVVAAALRYTASAFSGKAVCLLFDAQLPGTQGEIVMTVGCMCDCMIVCMCDCMLV